MMVRIGMLALAACGARAVAPIANEARVPCTSVTYATAGDGARRLIVHGDRLIALAGDAVRSYPLAGGAPTTIVTMHVIGDAIVVGDALVYSQYEGGGLYRVPLAGGTPVGFSGDMDGPQSIAPLAGGMFAVGGLTGLYRVARDGKVTKFLEGDDVYSSLAHDGVAYASTYDSVVALAATGRPKRVFAPAQGGVGALTADDRAIYFERSDADGNESIARYDFATGAVTPVAKLDDTPLALAISEGELYAGFEDHVMRVRDGAVVKSSAEVSTMIADDTGVYYATDEGAIARTCFTAAARPARP